MMANIRRWLRGNELTDILDELESRPITVVLIDEDGREIGEKKRKARKAEAKLLRGIFAGAIESMNWGEEVRSNDRQAKAIIECAEFTVINLWDESRGERIQSYLSVYNPLCEVLRNWERE